MYSLEIQAALNAHLSVARLWYVTEFGRWQGRDHIRMARCIDATSSCILEAINTVYGRGRRSTWPTNSDSEVRGHRETTPEAERSPRSAISCSRPAVLRSFSRLSSTATATAREPKGVKQLISSLIFTTDCFARRRACHLRESVAHVLPC